MLVAVQDQTGENWKHGSSLKQVRSASLRPDRADILANVFNDAECRLFNGRFTLKNSSTFGSNLRGDSNVKTQ